VCDTRMATMGYGRRLMAALPPMRVLKSKEEFLGTLEGLSTAGFTRTSTTDPAWT
jgi:ATP-dependent DNA helicase DinG